MKLPSHPLLHLNYQAYAFLSVFLQAFSVTLLKHAANQCGTYFCWQEAHFYGLVVFFILARVFFWNVALAKGSLSKVYNYTALTPFFLLCFAFFFLGEKINWLNLIGALVILLAIYFHHQETAKSSQKEAP